MTDDREAEYRERLVALLLELGVEDEATRERMADDIIDVSKALASTPREEWKWRRPT